MQLFLPKYEVEECLAALRDVLQSGWTGTGPVCRRFEEQWSDFTKAPHCLYVNSATAALHLALRVCDLPPHSPVLSTPLTFVSTNAVILYEGHFPVFVDINEDDLSLNAEDFERKREKFSARAALWVHYAGNISPHFYQVRDQLQHLSEKAECKIIEDCAHAAGASYRDGNPVGSLPETLSCFSFHSVKNLPTFDSGTLCSHACDLIQRARKLSWLGIDKDTYARTSGNQNDLYKWRYDVSELGWKYNGNDIAASIATVQLKYLKRDNAYRAQLHQWYRECLNSAPNVKVVTHEPGSAHHLFVIRVANREEVIGALKSEGIAPGVHYLPNNEFPVFQRFYQKGDCPNLERISTEIISLPNHLHLTQQDVERVAEVVIRAAKS